MQNYKAALCAALKADGIGVGEGRGNNLLFICKAIYRPNAIAKLSSLLKAQIFCGLRHAIVELIKQFLSFALEDKACFVYGSSVVPCCSVALTPCTAVAHMVVKTWSVLADITGKLLAAGGQSHSLGYDIDYLPCHAPAAVGAEVFCSILGGLIDNIEPRVLRVYIELYKGVALVVL